jgi:MarR family transcriptional regulator, lower aerobic nicotinate degradation pathway regulator
MNRNDEGVPTAGPGTVMEGHIGHLLRRAYMRARKNTAEALAVVGDVSPIQAAALAALANGEVTQAELGRRIEMEPANIHTLVKRLITAGLVETRTNPANRRHSLVTLTPAGEAVSARLATVIRVSAERTTAALDDAERNHLIELLQRIAL